MESYAFGAGGFKLGERVEILTTGQRGVLTSEFVHISGCNTYQVLLPNVVSEGKMRITHRDHLMLRRLEPGDSMFDESKELTDENSFSPKGTDVNAEWIREAINENKEFVPEVDDAVGVEEIPILPGTEVWNKVYGKTMFVSYICRDIFSKELEYGLSYMSDDKEMVVNCRAYALIELENKININLGGKVGPLFEDGRSLIQIGMALPDEVFSRLRRL
jgi:hypothetical protein